MPAKGLKPIEGDHEVYNSFYSVGDEGRKAPLRGVEVGGRLAVIYSDSALGSAWVGNDPDLTADDREKAFRMGINIYDYVVRHWLKR